MAQLMSLHQLQDALVALKQQHPQLKLRKGNRLPADPFPIILAVSIAAPPSAARYDIDALALQLLLESNILSASLPPPAAVAVEVRNTELPTQLRRHIARTLHAAWAAAAADAQGSASASTSTSTPAPSGPSIFAGLHALIQYAEQHFVQLISSLPQFVEAYEGVDSQGATQRRYAIVDNTSESPAGEEETAPQTVELPAPAAAPAAAATAADTHVYSSAEMAPGHPISAMPTSTAPSRDVVADAPADLGTPTQAHDTPASSHNNTNLDNRGATSPATAPAVVGQDSSGAISQQAAHDEHGPQQIGAPQEGNPAAAAGPDATASCSTASTAAPPASGREDAGSSAGGCNPTGMSDVAATPATLFGGDSRHGPHGATHAAAASEPPSPPPPPPQAPPRSPPPRAAAIAAAEGLSALPARPSSVGSDPHQAAQPRPASPKKGLQPCPAPYASSTGASTYGSSSGRGRDHDRGRGRGRGRRAPGYTDHTGNAGRPTVGRGGGAAAAVMQQLPGPELAERDLQTVQHKYGRSFRMQQPSVPQQQSDLSGEQQQQQVYKQHTAHDTGLSQGPMVTPQPFPAAASVASAGTACYVSSYSHTFSLVLQLTDPLWGAARGPLHIKGLMWPARYPAAGSVQLSIEGSRGVAAAEVWVLQAALDRELQQQAGRAWQLRTVLKWVENYAGSELDRCYQAQQQMFAQECGHDIQQQQQQQQYYHADQQHEDEQQQQWQRQQWQGHQGLPHGQQQQGWPRRQQSAGMGRGRGRSRSPYSGSAPVAVQQPSGKQPRVSSTATPAAAAAASKRSASQPALTSPPPAAAAAASSSQGGSIRILRAAQAGADKPPAMQHHERQSQEPDHQQQQQQQQREGAEVWAGHLVLKPLRRVENDLEMLQTRPRQHQATAESRSPQQQQQQQQQQLATRLSEGGSSSSSAGFGDSSGDGEGGRSSSSYRSDDDEDGYSSSDGNSSGSDGADDAEQAVDELQLHGGGADADNVSSGPGGWAIMLQGLKLDNIGILEVVQAALQLTCSRCSSSLSLLLTAEGGSCTSTTPAPESATATAAGTTAAFASSSSSSRSSGRPFEWSGSCGVCQQGLSVLLRPKFVHEGSNILAGLKTAGCSPLDLLPSVYGATCADCDAVGALRGLQIGVAANRTCGHCHRPMGVSISSVAFIPRGPDTGARASAKTPGSSRAAQRGQGGGGSRQGATLVEGSPLPDNGACKHYRHSYRWLRFPCCGARFPCDICHEEASADGHNAAWATRMVCGFCSREQLLAQACKFCGKKLATSASKPSGRNTRHWEGGQGCRDLKMLDRRDAAKYRNSKAKTKSAKASRVGPKPWSGGSGARSSQGMGAGSGG